MATYREIKGLKVPYLGSDLPSAAAETQAGSVWYNSATSKLRAFTSYDTWAASAPLSTGRGGGTSFGIQTAALLAGGYGTATEPTRWYGSISQMSFAISGSSPIVWRARIQFFVGNVITVFDSDSPESPQSLSAIHKTGTVDGNAWGSRDVIKVRFKDPSSFGATDVNSAIISYKLDGKLQWANVKYDIATTVANGADDKLTKVVGGADDEFYVVYLPPNTEEEHGADNYGGAANGAADSLTSGGLWDKTAYASATYTLTADKIYDVKVHFGNTSGEGGLSEVSVKTS